MQTSPVAVDLRPGRWCSARYLDGTAGVRSDGTLWKWGTQFVDDWHQRLCDDHGDADPAVRAGVPRFTSGASQGTDHVLALASNGMLLCWGADGSGQCGNGNGPPSTYVSGWEEERWEGTTPAFTWNAASAGDRFSVAVGADGSLWSWGLNDHGQLGIGGSGGTQSVLPVKVGSQAWTTASAGTTHALGVAADGTVWAWGDNSTGELGTAPSNLASSDLPVLVDAGTGWTSVAAGDGYSLALRSDGTLWAWGSNTAGQLGDGTTTEHDTPEQVGAGTTWSSVSAGALHAVARRSDGTIWAWGDDAFGELG